MKRLILIIGSLLLTSCSNEADDKKKIEIAKFCRAWVIKSSPVPAYSKFDAYYDPANAQWSYFGTDEERFRFRKCLVENGVQLSEQK